MHRWVLILVCVAYSQLLFAMIYSVLYGQKEKNSHTTMDEHQEKTETDHQSPPRRSIDDSARHDNSSSRNKSSEIKESGIKEGKDDPPAALNDATFIAELDPHDVVLGRGKKQRCSYSTGE
jgi:hypothetical protein